ncbi:ATP-binding cassette domain-containing protein [Alteromonas sp. A079]|uniref:ATP-binding cassette domain-containing protein n=1 Tax=Alteromonas sp. A079 TaxID=3410268 RepID=UPI003BA04C62
MIKPKNGPSSDASTRPAYLTLLLAMLHAVAGLSILVVSSWFIAISAIAPIGFNYVIPAVVIRAFALLRIASGYASMWVGHNDLLTRIATTRLAVFSQLTNSRLDEKALTTEALAHHTEELASKWIAWISPLSSVLLLFTSLCVGASLVMLPGVNVLWALYVSFLVLIVWQGVGALTLAKAHTQHAGQFRDTSSEFLNASAIWHLKHKVQQGNASTLVKTPSANDVWKVQSLHKQKAQTGGWLFQGMAFLLVVLICAFASPAFFVPIAVVVPMVILAAPEWASGAFIAISKYAHYQQSKKALQALNTRPLHQLTTFPLREELVLTAFKAEGRTMPALTTSLPAVGLVTVGGESGCGKSSLLQAIAGLLPSTGARHVDGNVINAGLVDKWLYVEQTPIVLSGSIALNLNPANDDVNKDDMTSCLRALGLTSLLPLTTWVGKGGRPLSGGESKRLVLARSLVAKPHVLLLDEPFEGLDSVSQHNVCELLNKASVHTLVIVASHIIPHRLNVSTEIVLTPRGTMTTRKNNEGIKGAKA